MTALVLAPSCDYKADWYSPTPASLRRPPDALALLASAALLEDLALEALAADQIEIFEMQILEYSSRQALSQCFMSEWLAGSAD